MSSQPYKKRRITPKAYPTLGAAMAANFNKPATKGEVAVLKRKVATLSRDSRNREFKHEDSSVSFVFDATGEVPASGQWTCGTVQGTNGTERIGEKTTVRSIQFRGVLTYTPTLSNPPDTTVHMYIVLDRQANGAAAAATDVFTSTNFAIALRARPRSDRFKILWHGEYTLGSHTTIAANPANPAVLPFSMYKKVNIPIKFSGSTGAVADMMSNNIFLLAGSDGNTDDLVTCLGTARLMFTDD